MTTVADHIDIEEVEKNGCILRTWRTQSMPPDWYGWSFSILQGHVEFDHGWGFPTREEAITFAEEKGVWEYVPDSEE